MARPTIIYKRRFSTFWFGLAVSVWCGGGAFWIQSTREGPLASAVGLGLLVFFAMMAFIYLIGTIGSWNEVAVLATDGTILTGWRASAAGRGSRFAVPIAGIDGWRWFDGRKQRNVVAVLEFTHGRDVYRVTPHGARKLDVEAFRVLAPNVVSDAIVHSSASLIGTKYNGGHDSGLH